MSPLPPPKSHSDACGCTAPTACPPRFGPRWQLWVVLLFNSAVALLLWLTVGERSGAGFLVPFIYSHCIGIATFAGTHLAARHAGHCGPTPRDAIAGLLLGSATGTLLAAQLTGTLGGLWQSELLGLGPTLLAGVAFGTIPVYFIFSKVRMAETQAALQEQQLRRTSAEKALAETRLRLLQAQIEPHFLFNTLSTVHSLIGTHPQRAARMLESLTDYLRASLARTREQKVTLGDEMALIRAYLSVQAERMGERLAFELPADPALLELPLPPLLIQPLVENAVIHGLEPLIEGGRVVVKAQRSTHDWLQIDVEDDGAGFGPSDGGSGVGLANVRARLASLYGEAARLTVRTRVPRGVCSRIELPLVPEGPAT